MKKKSAAGLYRLEYRETTGEGTFRLYVEEISGGRTTICLQEAGGGRRQYLLKEDVFTPLAEAIDAHEMLDWDYLETCRVERSPETEISVRIRIASCDRVFGTERMPFGGLEALRGLKRLALSYAREEEEILPQEVMIEGRAYMTVRGTGNIVGMGAEVDLQGRDWWTEFGYAGHYELSEGSCIESGKTVPWAVFDIFPDGRYRLEIPDFMKDEGRLKSAYIHGSPQQAGRFWMKTVVKSDGNRDRESLCLIAEPDPCPGPFPGYELRMKRI